ncbi:hypothetical protein OG21DRAFT_1142813 [Imleria badia]|nr:hypothetical protein OG21DRAFT_1142813 [Imleria badia]
MEKRGEKFGDVPQCRGWYKKVPFTTCMSVTAGVRGRYMIALETRTTYLAQQPEGHWHMINSKPSNSESKEFRKTLTHNVSLTPRFVQHLGIPSPSRQRHRQLATNRS